ncbi:MAG: RNA polymerase sigma factor, partial [Bacteroidales bacterium]
IEWLRTRESYVVKYLSNRYMPVIRHMVVQMGGTSEDAQDIFQEGLVIILEKIDDRTFTLTSKFITLFYCICENLWKMVLLKKKAADNFIQSAETYQQEPDIDEQIDNEIYQAIFREAFDSLDDSGKKILRLYWQGKSPSEIADMLGFTYGYVRKKKSTAQAELTEKVKKHPDYIRIMKTEQTCSSAVQIKT